jgi:hypothetical protein
MNRRTIGLYVRLALAGGCIVMGLLSFAGVFSKDVANGRLIFGAGWTLIGAGWLFRCYIGWKQQRRDREGGDDGR